MVCFQLKRPPSHTRLVHPRAPNISPALSDHDPTSPTTDTATVKLLTPSPVQDLHSLLNTLAPMILSTPLERTFLNSLSALGLDTGQMVHSVLSDACDAAGALGWALKRKAEKTALEDERAKLLAGAVNTASATKFNTTAAEKQSQGRESDADKKRSRRPSNATRDPSSKKQMGVSVSVQTDPPPHTHTHASHGLPQPRPVSTRARADASDTHRPNFSQLAYNASTSDCLALSPAMSPTPLGHTGEPAKSPVDSLKEKEGSKGRRDGKGRSVSVSIMQCATIVLEAAGLVKTEPRL